MFNNKNGLKITWAYFTFGIQALLGAVTPKSFLGTARHMTVAVLIILLGSGSILADCGNDNDCKGDRICEDGQCMSPGTPQPEKPKPAHAAIVDAESAIPVEQPATNTGAAPVPAQPVAARPLATAPISEAASSSSSTMQTSPAPPVAETSSQQENAPTTAPSTTAGINTDPALPQANEATLQSKAKGGYITGLVFDIAGFGTFLMGGTLGPATGDIWLGQGLALGGSGLMAIGSFIGSGAMTARHNAYLHAGYSPNGSKGGAWTLSVMSLLCFGAAMGMGIPSDMESLGLTIAAISTAGIGCILEVINFNVRKKWNQRLKESRAASSKTVKLFPSLTFVTNRIHKQAAIPLFGLSGLI